MAISTVRHAALLAATLAALAPGRHGKVLEYPYYNVTPRQAKRWKAQRDYPQSGTGKRQGERLMRQKANFMLDFSASERCIAAIKARQS